MGSLEPPRILQSPLDQETTRCKPAISKMVSSESVNVESRTTSHSAIGKQGILSDAP